MISLYQTKASKSNQQAFLLLFFSKPDINEQKEVNGFILNKYKDKYHGWLVQIFTKESWAVAQKYIPQVGSPIKSQKRKTQFKKLFDELTVAVNRQDT